MPSSKKDIRREEIYLPTGVKELDKILAMDIDPSEKSGGFLVGCKAKDSDLETSVILINGESGTGKTSLILQIAFSAARTSRWIPCFFALEQSFRSMDNMADSFGQFKQINVKQRDVHCIDLANDIPNDFGKKTSALYFFHLSPRPITEDDVNHLFQARLNELDHIINQVKSDIKDDNPPSNPNKLMPVFLLDSLNAFSTATLSRNEIYRLFSLFKNHHVPVILTMENHKGSEGGAEGESVQNARFLSDCVVRLSKDNSTNYLKYFLEIEKSRFSRQALGKHLYKIRTMKLTENIEHDPRTGIVLYPSIHSVLSKASEHEKHKDKEFIICENDRDLENIFKTSSANPKKSVPNIKLGECFSIIGPAGTHKLALGMSLSMGHEQGLPPSLLLINFGGTGDYKFENVAWTSSRQYCTKLVPIAMPLSKKKIKFWKTYYRCKTPNLNPTEEKNDTRVTIVNFKIGALTTEECFYVIESVVNEDKEKHYSSVLLSDTAELCNGFPMLVSDTLFLPALVDLFSTRNMVTVCIGVDEGQSARNTDINYSLSSRADYRIVLSHYPSIHDLSGNIVEAFKQKNRNNKIHNSYQNEQLVSMILDNVTGKDYTREPIWLRAESINGDKYLRCEKTPFIKFKETPAKT
jgi:KaiC/GvpD/RAD55 family RecA-like ATPase